MPSRPPAPCTYPGCKEYAAKGSRCEEHKRKAWDHQGKTAHQRGYGATWRKLRDAALTRDKHLCQPCLERGILTQAKEVDHIAHKATGGTDSLDNLQAICHTCHKRKTQAEAQEARGRGEK